MALAAAVGVANEGAKLFAAGDFAAAAQRFTAALDGLPAYDAAESDCRDADTAQVALSRARALNNRASCSLRTGVPLAALDDVADALATLCDPARMARGVPIPRPGCAGFAVEALGVMLTSVLKLAAAYDAAGSPVGALPLVAWAAVQPATVATRAKLEAALERLTHAELAPPATAAGTLPAGLLPARAGQLPLVGRVGCPPGRRAGAGAAVAGHLYVVGGIGEDFTDAPEFWRVPLTKPPGGAPWDWQRLPSPGGAAGGPSSTRSAVLAAAHATSELLCLAERRLWALPCGGDGGASAMRWRDLGMPWPSAGNRLQGPSLSALGDAALVYAPYCGLVSINLRTGARDVLWVGQPEGSPRAWTMPQAWSPHLWPCGSSALLLWGGGAPDVEGGTALHGYMLISPPPLGDMWRFELMTRTWTRVPRGGGGAPPPPRAEAALVPLTGGGFEDGAAVLVCGYSELLSQAQGPGICRTGFRYCDDAHLYTPTAGWRRLVPAGPRAMPAASVAAGFTPAAEGESGGCVCFCGGYSLSSGSHSYAQVTALHLSPCGAASEQGSAAGPQRAAALRAAALSLLQGGASSQLPLRDSPVDALASMGMRVEQRRHESTDWAQLLSSVLALPRGQPQSQAVISWQEMRQRLRDPQSPLVFGVQVTNFHQAPDRRVLDFLSAEPQACEVARCLLLSLMAPPGEPAMPRPCSVLFAARVGGAIMRALAPLLELLEAAPLLETWAAAALSSLMHDTCPHGYNAVRRCVHCKRAADGRRPAEPRSAAPRKVKLRSCAACGMVSYCGAECQRADWPQHKELCRYAVEWKKQGGQMP